MRIIVFFFFSVEENVKFSFNNVIYLIISKKEAKRIHHIIFGHITPKIVLFLQPVREVKTTYEKYK